MVSPLADILRPKTLDEYIGQDHLVGPQKPLRLAIENGTLHSMILWGPPGVGKTTLARMLAQASNRKLFELSAVSAGKSDIRAIVEEASDPQQALLNIHGAPVLFLDEIHRFNKAQQDFLLPYVERGTIILIGATTENPSFEVNNALLSRSTVYVLQQLSQEQLEKVLTKAYKHLQKTHPSLAALDAKAQELLLSLAQGDARKLIGIIDATIQTYAELTPKSILNALTHQPISYDAHGEDHHNTISAFIKSMRASKPDAAIYYLARMIEAGEDPLFIARRMVIFASEDIGIAQPTALVVANAVFQACQTIGYPECGINLAHGVVYLSQAPKNRSAYDGLRAAQQDVQQHGPLPIPLILRNAPTKLLKELGYGDGYEMYPPKSVSFLPDKLQKTTYIAPAHQSNSIE